MQDTFREYEKRNTALSGEVNYMKQTLAEYNRTCESLNNEIETLKTAKQKEKV